MVLELFAVLSFCGFCHLFLLEALPDRPYPPQKAGFILSLCQEAVCPPSLHLLCGYCRAHRWPLSGKASSCWFSALCSSSTVLRSPWDKHSMPLVHPIAPVLVLRAVDPLPVSHFVLVTVHGCKSPQPRTSLHFSHLDAYDVHDYTPLQPGVTLACM